MKRIAGWVSCVAGAGLMLTGPVMAQKANSAQPSFVNTLMPEPAQLTVGSGALPIGPGFAIHTDRHDDARLNAAIQWAVRRLKMQTGLLIPETPANGTAAVVMTVEGPGEAIQGPDENESYSLDVTPQGAHLHAATDVGAMHGLETLVQLVQTDGHGSWIPAVTIQDSPRFRWRGLMIDCSRHFVPLDVILRTLDGMAAVKLNVFHWHLTDDQGFRIESKVFPS